jgi:hypothetical protein
MSGLDFAGLYSGGAGIGLLALGIVLTLFASLRLVFVIRRPHKGRIARAFAASGLVLFVCGAGLFAAADLTYQHPSFRHALDSLSRPLVIVSFLLAILAALRFGRRRTAKKVPDGAPEKAQEAEQPAQTEKPGGPASSAPA